MADASSNSSPLLQLTLCRLREFYREPAAVFWVYCFPLILAVILGVAFQNRPVERILVDVVTDGPGGEPAARQLEATLKQDDRLQITLGDEKTCRNRMRTAKTDLVITPAVAPALPEYLTEPNRPEAVLAKNAVENLLLRLLSPGTPRATEKTLDEYGSRYIDFLIPGLVGMNLMGGGLWGIGFVVVDMRVRKLLKRFLATPMKKTDFLLSLALSRFIFTFIEVGIFLVFARFAFGVRIFGDLTALLVLLLVGGVCFSGIGLLIACRAKTIETVSGLMNLVMLPMWLLSGVFFSAERFPVEIQPVVQALPLTILNNALRGVMNDGGGFSAIVVPSLLLLAWGGVSFFLALKLFRWR